MNPALLQPFPLPLLEHVRRRFPALDSPWALFDNAGGSVPVAGVIERVREYMATLGVQLGATYELSARGTALVAAGHEAAARLLNAGEGEAVLGSSTTANLRLLARALRPRFAPGDEIVVSTLEHESNSGPWRALEAEGVVIREWRFRPETCALHAADLEALLGPRTKLVAFTHCANVVGTIHDAAGFIRRIHAAGSLACVDGVAYAPHRRVDVKAIDADFYLVSLYKVFGPHLGLLYGKRDLLRAAASQNHFFVGEDELPRKLEPGSVPHELAASLPGILDHLLELAPAAEGEDEGAQLARAFDAIAGHEAALVAPLLDFLQGRGGVRLLGEPTADPARRVATVAFASDRLESPAITRAVDESRVAIRHGDFYARRAIDALGLGARGGVVRASLAHYNTPDEVTRLIEALDRVL